MSKRLQRGWRILRVALKFGLMDFLPQQSKTIGLLRWISSRFNQGAERSQPRAMRLRLSLEALGPIFVKFGQMLSTRRDLLPTDIADELAQLQDNVPPVAWEQAQAILSEQMGADWREAHFSEFTEVPIASASVAQVYFAVLKNGTPVAVKILRPNIQRIIEHDLGLLDMAAWIVETFLPDGKRLRPREVVEEFRRHLLDELDLQREAANASQLKRNFKHSALLQVPEIHWDYSSEKVMVMQRMEGIPISHIAALQAANIDLPQLASDGVEIFFTQVFRHGFFHADMHPGNILVAANGQYVALDFGIMGSLTDADKHYLAVNFLAFFERDYRRVAEAHIQSGWAPPDTNVQAFENAVRAVCEPIFDRPLHEISFGKVLLRLFQTSRRFNIVIQPQLVMLQKTLLNIEGLGRELDPNLDLWKTAKPFLQIWMQEQMGWRALLRQVKHEAPEWANLLPQIPRKVHELLQRSEKIDWQSAYMGLMKEQRKQNWLLFSIALSLLALVVIVLGRS